MHRSTECLRKRFCCFRRTLMSALSNYVRHDMCYSFAPPCSRLFIVSRWFITILARLCSRADIFFCDCTNLCSHSIGLRNFGWWCWPFCSGLNSSVAAALLPGGCCMYPTYVVLAQANHTRSVTYQWLLFSVAHVRAGFLSDIFFLSSSAAHTLPLPPRHK